MLPIKRNCRFLIDKEKGKSDGRLRYRIRWGKNTVAFNVGYRVELEKWIADAQRCKANSTHGEEKLSGNEINKAIQFYENTIEDLFYKYEQEEIYPTKDKLRSDFNIILNNNEGENELVVTLFDKFIDMESKRSEWTKDTIAKMNVIKRHLYRFRKNLEINSINEDTLQEFIHYLSREKRLRNSTVKKHFSFVTWFLRWARDYNYYKGKAHLTYNPKFKGTNTKEIIYLTWEELTTLRDFDFSNPTFEKVRDVFCFCCFTGLRYSDVAKLKKEDIEEDHINVVTKKTVDRLKIELNNHSKAILNKYKEVKLPENKALPIISNQKMNMYLKDIAKLAEIDTPIREVYFIGNKRYEEVLPKYELITTHCGRRTFVVNALRLGIPSEVIMKWTGHSDFDSMKPYVKIVDELKKSEMDKFNKL